ncbi:MAG: rRNA maturation RNase YbeY [Planctomycetes bacterium]|nr:rRNA maturation RNase YbeY [Planctomycetota bacterium]
MPILRRVRFDRLDDREVRRIVRAALAHGGRPDARVGVVLMGDAELARLHEEHLGDPSLTDVIAFDLGADGGLAGEICCSVACARRVARSRGVPVERELALYLVHGALHLCGHDDHAPRARTRMRAAERAVLAALGYPDDPLPHP